ncbi:hypothetical protein EZ313_02100 [Ramlibacter henchirensis]|uniref:RcnB family protein n=1 Tax=Ramlibacter henchirensis TaxID=204072 RepID=A0A4Z0C1J3_9BURK|nr:RcnB family protein [Ramlibacter henchirensis]TFZ05487.1 hypothetical protein EZ313_02100 [Ramlibacter henchirensis]
MTSKTIVCSIALASLGFTSLAFAQPSRHEVRQDAREAREDIRDARRDLRHADTRREEREARRDLREAQRDLRAAREERRYGRRYYNARGPEFQRGGRLPAELRQRHHVVSDWHQHHLAAPPRGHQWVQVGSDYVLAAIATGLIAHLIFGQ